MFKALWDGVNNINTRTKCNQSSVLLLQIVYGSDTAKVYGMDSVIGMNASAVEGKREEQFRSSTDYNLDLSVLETRVLASDKVSAVRYYTEAEHITSALQNLQRTHPKLKPMEMPK